jgi:hypothetical protein
MTKKSPVVAASLTEDRNVRRTHMGEPKSACPMIVQECELAMNMSYVSDEQDDGEGNKVRFCLWVSGDWKIDYKGKEYLIPMSENVNALINWINSQESK